ncbi:hypothetical protein E8E11_011393 [Didymella keratinophila]|nr:hypothetical protein E8E11_011393 [Didymella keratinophila]
MYPIPQDQRRVYFHTRHGVVNIHEHLQSKFGDWRVYYREHENYTDEKGETHYTDNEWIDYWTYSILSFWLYRGLG